MSTRADAIIAAALARDGLIDAQVVTAQQAEVLAHLGRVLRKHMATGIRENPEYFGVVKNVALSASGGVSGWSRPDDAMSVYRIEATADTKDQAAAAIANGTEITVVPFDDRAFMAGDPAVYEFARRYVRAGNAGDPASGSLNIMYAAFPVVPSALVDNIDTRFPDSQTDLLVCEMNLWFAARDGRPTEAFEAARNEALAIYLGFLNDATLVVSRRTQSFRETTVVSRTEA